MWLCEDKLIGKTAHLPLPSASQQRACLSSLISIRSLGSQDDNGDNSLYISKFKETRNFIPLHFAAPAFRSFHDVK